MGVRGVAAQGQHALCHLIDLELEVGVELFELGVELKKRLAPNVPVEPAGVHVKDREVGQQVIQTGRQLGRSLCIQSDGRIGVHIESTLDGGDCSRGRQE